MVKLRSKRFCLRMMSMNSSKDGSGGGGGGSIHRGGVAGKGCGGGAGGEIKWELRPGGMLVQRRECGAGNSGEGMITVRVSTVSRWHDISIQPTSTFGELKMVLALVTALEPREQRLLFKGKEREDGEYLHMVGVGDRDKVLLLEDPAFKERKLRSLAAAAAATGNCQAIRTTSCPAITI
ncbi:BAG family molecular chaperone regulator 1 [Malania oleifera]|uniref:BAG family molecular chaperone regulator 1 n=1 Tax=Malania oleifera TaxID=397392 RepID=UPI0025AE4538|nr:BAG family molecular chaperone regulator 1 [Malania oleifera]